MRLPLKILAGILAFTSVVLMAVITLPYLSLRHDIKFLLTKQSVLHIIFWRYSFYIHIVSSFFVLLAGSIQMLFKLTPKLHRKLGATYVLLILIFAAPSGLIMSFYSNGGIIASISFSLLSILWWVFTCRCFQMWIYDINTFILLKH